MKQNIYENTYYRKQFTLVELYYFAVTVKCFGFISELL